MCSSQFGSVLCILPKDGGGNRTWTSEISISVTDLMVSVVCFCSMVLLYSNFCPQKNFSNCLCQFQDLMRPGRNVIQILHRRIWAMSAEQSISWNGMK